MRGDATAADDPRRLQMWSGQAAALGRVEPAGRVVARVWDEADGLLGR
jgi:hypothetical protein